MADYLVNLETYKKNCVNKAKPMLHCNGKCQLFKKMNKQGDENGANASVPKLNQFEVVLSSKSFFSNLEIIYFKIQSTYFSFNSSVFSDYFSSIFRPPSDCNII
jgi:hypothetical protein